MSQPDRRPQQRSPLPLPSLNIAQALALFIELRDLAQQLIALHRQQIALLESGPAGQPDELELITVAEAARLLDGLAPQPALAEPTEEPAARPTYAVLFAEWRTSIATSLKRSTLRHYDTAIAQWLSPHLGERQISAADYRFLQQLFNEELSPRFAPTATAR